MGFFGWLAGKLGGRAPSPADGSSKESAIVVSDVAQEYALLEARFGRPGVDWDLVMQSLVESDGRYFDLMRVRVGATEVVVFFDVTSTMDR